MASEWWRFLTDELPLQIHCLTAFSSDNLVGCTRGPWDCTTVFALSGFFRKSMYGSSREEWSHGKETTV